jgi:hypothetical protein
MTTAKEPLTRASFLKSVISQLKPKRHSEAPANKPSDKSADPARIGVLSDEPKRRTSLNASAPRCQFTFADGRRCKMPPTQLCSHHSPQQKRGTKRVSDASALEALCTDLTTATNINRALAQTFLLMAQGRISRKDAVAFGYLSQLMLQTVAGIRAEYVSAFGYDPWEEKLKASLGGNPDGDPESSPDGDSGPSGGGRENPEHTRNGVVGRQKGMPITPLLPHKEGERGIPPKPLPVNKSSDDEQSPSLPGEPDFADLLRRGRNLVEGKYDTTPEGRREMQKLTLELELMKPAPAKPARDFIGRVAHLQRTIDAGMERDPSPASSIPPALDYYGHPIQPYVTPPPWESATAIPGCAPPNASTSADESPVVPHSAPCSSGRGETAVGEPALRHLNQDFAPSPQSLGPYSFGSPQDFVAPPSRRHRKPRSGSIPVGPAPHTELPSPLSISSSAAPPDSAGGPDADHHEGHSTDWYAPPSWSKIRPPDPCPSRKEQLQHKLRSMSNSAFRRLQHRNSRGL